MACFLESSPLAFGWALAPTAHSGGDTCSEKLGTLQRPQCCCSLPWGRTVLGAQLRGSSEKGPRAVPGSHGRRCRGGDAEQGRGEGGGPVSGGGWELESSPAGLASLGPGRAGTVAGSPEVAEGPTPGISAPSNHTPLLVGVPIGCYRVRPGGWFNMLSPKASSHQLQN